MHFDGSAKTITDPTYLVPGYHDYFGDISKVQNDERVVTQGTYNGNSIVVQQKKAYIIIRYVEIINALQRFLKK